MRRLYCPLSWLLATVVVAALLWFKVLEDRFIPRRLGVVEESIVYRSGQLHAALVRSTLERLGIRRIIDLTGPDPDDPHEQAERDASEALGIERVDLWLRGNGTGEISTYATAVASLHDAVEQRLPVLVHCHAGTQRAGGVVASYRLLVQERSPVEILDELQRYDWDPVDDRILVDYLDAHMPTLAALLVERGVLEAVPPQIPRLGTTLDDRG